MLIQNTSVTEYAHYMSFSSQYIWCPTRRSIETKYKLYKYGQPLNLQQLQRRPGGNDESEFWKTVKSICTTKDCNDTRKQYCNQEQILPTLKRFQEGLHQNKELRNLLK